MKAGHRVFVVNGDDVVRIAQKAFDAFYLRASPTMPQYAGSIITVAVVFYALKNQAPHHIISLSCSKMKVNSDGSLDQDHSLNSIFLSLDRKPARSVAVTRAGSILDANAAFKERQFENLHPKLSGPAHKKILMHLFGTAIQ